MSCCEILGLNLNSHNFCQTSSDAGNYIRVSGGKTFSGFIDSTEILEPGNNSWGKGPSLPLPAYGSSIVEDDSNSRVLILGGYSDGVHFGSIYQLKAPLTITR